MLIEAREGAVVTLTLNNPAKRNALALPLRIALIEAFERLEADKTVRAIVLTGAGTSFCSGGDIDSMAEVTGLAVGRERFRRSHHLVRLMVKSSKPIIAAVEGWAAGAGIGLALACDTIIAAKDARFVASFARLGLIGDFGLLHTLPRRVGEGYAKQMLLYAEPIDAVEALRVGLVDRVVEKGKALEAAYARAAILAEGAPLAAAYTKAHFARGLDELLDWEREAQSALLLSRDHQEGRAAFLEKRKPVFTGD